MAYFIGLVIGGVIGIYLLSSLLEWAVFKRVVDDPVVGKVGSVVAAYAIAVAAYGLSSATADGQWNPLSILNYLPGAVIVGALKYRAGIKARDYLDGSFTDIFS